MIKVLLTNDDGIQSPGLQSLKQELENDNDIQLITIAPKFDQSGVSQKITLFNPIFFEQLDYNSFAIDGTPSDCVKIAFHGFKFQDIDLVVSGINVGCNLGLDILYSGTIAAGREALIQSTPALCLSLDTYSSFRLSIAKKAHQLIKSIVTLSLLPKMYLFNINLPNLANDKIKGIRITSLGKASHLRYTKGRSPLKKTFFWLDVDLNQPTELYSDKKAIEDGYISLTPLNQEFSHESMIEQLKNSRIFEQFCL